MALEPITRQEKIIAGKDLEPITRMEKFLKKYGGSGGSGGVSPEEVTTIVKEQFPGGVGYSEVTEGDVTMCDGSFSKYDTLDGVVLEIGKEYTIVYDGVTYTSVCFDDEGFRTIGGVANDYTEYPFNICATPGRGVELYCDDSNMHTIQISAFSTIEKVSKIDSKYLPTGLVVTFTNLMEDDSIVCDIGFSGVFEAVKNANCTIQLVRYLDEHPNPPMRGWSTMSAVFAHATKTGDMIMIVFFDAVANGYVQVVYYNDGTIEKSNMS